MSTCHALRADPPLTRAARAAILRLMREEVLTPLTIYSIVDPGRRDGRPEYFEHLEEAIRWRDAILAEYGSAPNISELTFGNAGGLVDYLNQWYDFENDE